MDVEFIEKLLSGDKNTLQALKTIVEGACSAAPELAEPVVQMILKAMKCKTADEIRAHQAESLVQFRNALVDGGFTPEQAFELCKIRQYDTVNLAHMIGDAIRNRNK